MNEITWEDFEKVELRVGTVLRVEEFPNARNPSYKLYIDFGDFGVKKSSAQITHYYERETLVGRQVLAVINFPKKQIADFMSECLVTGVLDEASRVVLVEFGRPVPNGARLM